MTDTQLIPLDDRIILRPLEADLTSKSGLHIELEDRGYPVRGRVEAVGPGVVHRGGLTPVDAKSGDEVYYVKGSETELPDGRVIVGEGSLVATIQDGVIEPYWDKVLIELQTEVGTSAGGVILVATNESFDRGTVVATGPGFPKKGFRAPMELASNDKIVFNSFEALEIDLGVDDSRRMFLTREIDVYGIIT